MTTDAGGNKIKVGQMVGWKSGTEQYGKVVAVNGQNIIVGVWNGDIGERENQTVRAGKCWIEE